MNKVFKCPICKSNNNIKKWTSPGNTDIISSSECVDCDIVFSDTIILDSKYIEYYNNYNKKREFHNDKKKNLRNLCYINDKKFVNVNCGNEFNNILDVGCGNGKFLSLFSSQKKTGFDIDKNIIEQNKKNYKDITFIYNLDKINKEEKFDLIIFRGTFQYMRDIDFIKTFIDSKLKNNGYLVILSLPNKNSPLALLQKENWGLYNPIEMFNIFSLSSIKNLFINYKLLNYEFPYIETPYANEKENNEQFIDLIINKKQHKFPYWGSMIQIIFKK